MLNRRLCLIAVCKLSLVFGVLVFSILLSVAARSNPSVATNSDVLTGEADTLRSVIASSEFPGWSAAKAIDDNDVTVWSSAGHGPASNAVEWLAVDYGHVQPFLGVRVTPRPGGACFPVDYRIEYTTNLASWVTVPGMVFTNQAAPRGAITLNFSNAVFARALRLYATRLSTDGANHYLQLAEFSALRNELWATPAELRGKKFIGGGQFGISGGETAVTSRYLAKHPDFPASFPYDGYVVPAVISAEWGEKLGLPRRDYFLHELLWNTVELPYEAIASIVADLNSVRWGGLTDNFLNYTMTDGARGHFTPDFANDRDWAIIEHNAAMAARLCREAKLQGFWIDTEQYGNYRWRTASGVPEFDTNRPANLKFPFGKDTPDLLRRRGAQWIKAVQAQFPPVKIIVTFAWSPDANEYGPLKGSTAFLDGVLDAIEKPGQLIHGYENTFYYGQGPGTLNAANDGRQEGFPGDRSRYKAARVSMREWRAFSGNPKKYDAIVKVGMAAWVEDDPWNLHPGWPGGTKASFWSNLPLALAYSDEYVWVWSEHTKYGQAGNSNLNPFLASLRNETFNIGQEPAAAFEEDFTADPLQQGWCFDFDMLAIGRKADPAHEVPTMSLEAVPYRWNPAKHGVQIQGHWPLGADGKKPACSEVQRRRYVRPIQPVTSNSVLEASFEFQVENFPTTPSNPIVLGLFQSDQTLSRNSLTFRLISADSAVIQLAVNNQSWVSQLPLKKPMKAGETYRVSFEFDTRGGKLTATLSARDGQSSAAKAKLSVPKGVAVPGWDEVGAALLETSVAESNPSSTYGYLLRRACLNR